MSGAVKAGHALVRQPLELGETEHDEAYISATQAPPRPDARLPRPHGNERRPQGIAGPPRQGALSPEHAAPGREAHQLARAVAAGDMARVGRLRPHGEFERVRQNGRSWPHRFFVLIALARTDRLERPS